MFWRTFLLFFSRKLNFIRGVIWFICGLAMGVRSIVLGVILLVVCLVLNFFATRLEIFAQAKVTSPPPPSSKAQKDLSAMLQALMAANIPE